MKTWKGQMTRNILKRRKESNTYLTCVCRYCWSRKSPVKIEEISRAFTDIYVYMNFNQPKPGLQDPIQIKLNNTLTPERRQGFKCRFS